MNHDLDTIDPTFVEDLKASHSAVQVAAEWLRSSGYPVIVRPTFVRPTAEERRQYSDGGDLEILQRVEVKQRPEIDFKDPRDFPFSSIIVDVCHAYDQARPKPHAYMILNASLSAAFVVKCSTRRQWSRVERTARGRARDYYECPLNLTEFVRMPNQ